MDYREHAPPPALAGLVKGRWTLAGGRAPDIWTGQQATPDGCIELIRRTRGRSHWGGEQPASFVVGLIDRPQAFTISGDAAFEALRLWPWAWSRLGGAPPAMLRGRWQACDAPDFDAIEARLAGEAAFNRIGAAILAARTGQHRAGGAVAKRHIAAPRATLYTRVSVVGAGQGTGRVHGTYRSIHSGTIRVQSVRFAMPVGAAPPSSDALRKALCAGALAAGAGLALTALPTARQIAPPALERPPETVKNADITTLSAAPARAIAAADPAQGAAREPPAFAATIVPRRASLPASIPRFHIAPVARPIDPPVPVPAIFPAPPVPPVAVTLPESLPPVAIAIPPAPPAASPAATPAAATVQRVAVLAAAAPSRAAAVQIEQLAAADRASAYLPQLTATGRDRLASPHGLAFAADMSQLPAPAALSREQRATLLTEAPTQLSLVVDGRRLGDVAIRMVDTTTVEVQLAGLLDLLAPRFDAQEFAALRGAPAAGGYVSLAQLDAAGIDLDYDPVYDELTLSA
ncbi:MAG: hypothetical protein HEQ22_16075 [Sphingopyxis sp.]|uniref:DUF6597 domain-containing transcriptional factor n=1 Tax=Sphingopyxis sp. TaxID=1908224 RepID=UPI003D80B315